MTTTPDTDQPAAEATAPATPGAPGAAEVPMIWTTLGNVPVHALQYQAKWERTSAGIRFGETYTTAGGLVVRETWHHMPAHLLPDAAAA